MSSWLSQKLSSAPPKRYEHVKNGLRLFEEVRELTGSKVMLSFSRGKDAIAAWIAIRDHFDVYPYYLREAVTLEFIEESLEYFERKMGTKIIRIPHRAVYDRLVDFIHQPPERCRYIEAMGIEPPTYLDIAKAAAEKFDLPETTYYGTGVRAFDNMARSMAIKSHGPITKGQQKFHPVWDWSINDVVVGIKEAGIKLPIDYKVFGSTLDGIHARYLVQMRKHFPKDYKRVLEFYPMAELVCWRYDRAKARGELTHAQIV
jgi:hypothetical protein